ncbi:MAG: cation diffusion facilitator family transporter [Chitinophagales bacterium]|nr:cation diffusion facilitator family transporter [Chitinophagales bacterium]MDW8272796.1 cation diffusion facilitator family transporter [Chitinophagales bacterium]
MLSSSQPEVRVQRAALGVSVLLLGVKFGAWYVTGSNAILTDALESIINVVAGAFALYAVLLSAKPRDREHPYGHGKIEFIVSGIEGGMIALAGLLMTGKAVVGFFEPVAIHNVSTGIILTVLTGGINLITALWLISSGKRYASLPLVADGKHLLTDAYSSLLVVGSLLMVWFTGWSVVDNIAACLLGIWIGWVGYRLIRKSLAGIMDEADMELMEEIASFLSQNRKAQWIDVHNLRVIQYGNRLHIDCHITFPFYYNLEQVHREMDDIAHLVNTAFGKQAEFFIHPDPCTPDSCKICSLNLCHERKHAFEKKIEWTKDNISLNQKHHIHETK